MCQPSTFDEPAVAELSWRQLCVRQQPQLDRTAGHLPTMSSRCSIGG